MIQTKPNSIKLELGLFKIDRAFIIKLEFGLS